MSVPPAIDLQGLLAEDRWIRRLARRLAGDGESAEDLVQDAWVAALDARSGGPRRLRPWLRGIMRNLWVDRQRTGAARADRERIVARDEALEPASELVAELELRKRVAEALLALEEPYRTALYLRFFKDRSLAVIARGQGVGVTTVHERIQQGLARLRARLDREHGGRRAWSVGLLSLARPAGWWTAASEAVAMAGGLKLAASVLVIGGGVAWWWAEHGRGPERAPLAPAPIAVESTGPGPGELVPVEMRDGRAAIGERATAPAPPAGAAALTPEPALVHGRVVDPHGFPVSNVAVGWAGTPADAASTRSGPDGSFAIADTASTGSARVRCLEPDLVTLVPGERGFLGRPESWLVVVAPRASFAGLVLDPAGAPVAGAKVSFGLREVLFRELGLHRAAFAGPDGETATAEDGSFALADVAGGDRVLLQVEAEGFWIATADLPETSASDLLIRLERDARSTTITGIVVDRGGAAVADARISAGDGIVTSDGEGRFELSVGQVDGTFGPLEPAAEQRAEEELRDNWLVALKPGFLPARERLGDLDLALPVVLRLGAEPATIRGRVLDPEGRPRAGIAVWARDPTPFGREIMPVAEGTTITMSQTIEDELVGGFGQRGATSDERGEFELGGLLERSYELMAFDPVSAELCGPWTVPAGSRAVELVMARQHRGRVAGRVVSAGGKPLAGIEVSPWRSAEAGASAHSQPPWGSHRKVATDAEGRFDLGEIALGGTELLLEGSGAFFLRSVKLADHDDPARLEIVEPVLCELQVDLTGDPAFADSVKVLDGEGRELETMEAFDNGWSLGTEARFRQGLTSVLSIKETAETLVLYRSGVEVLRRPLRLDPDQRTTVRP